VLGPEPTTFELNPRDGNIHELLALEDAAFLDITTPPYSDACGRPCTYYASAPASTDSTTRFVLTPTPATDMRAVAVPYRGPPFCPTSAQF